VAVLELLRRPCEPLFGDQQAALQHALAALDVSAPDPFKLAPDLRALAKVYLSERSYSLREAIDIWVRDRRESTVDSLNAGAGRLSWTVHSALVQADVLGAAGGGSAVARAVVNAQWKDWVGAWLEFLDDMLRESSALDARFDQALGRATNADVLNDLLSDAQRFVAGQAGNAALWVGRKVVEKAVTRTLGGDLERVQPEAQAAVLTQLEVAAREVSPTALGSYTLVSSARKDLADRVSAVAGINDFKMAQAEALLARIDQQAADVNTIAERIAQQSRQIRENVDRFGTDYARFNADLAGFNASRTTLVQRVDGLNTDLVTLSRSIERLQAPRSAPPAAAKRGAPKAATRGAGAKRAAAKARKT
jgi:hypothetical protein